MPLTGCGKHVSQVYLVRRRPAQGGSASVLHMQQT